MTAGAEGPFGLFEMGSNSLKLYLVPRGDGPVETVKFPWRVAHDHYRAGVLDPATADEVVERVRQAARLLEERHASGTLAIATGVFRELAELDAIAERLVGETGVRPRVISGADEAALMARGFREIGIGAPAVMCDLGGGSLEWAFEPPSGEVTSGSLPLGAIRCTYRFARAEPASDAYLSEAHAYCDALLAPLPIAGPARLVATGGTAEALATVVGHGRVRGARIDALVERVRREGPPAGLGPARRPVFLAGLVILSRVAARCGSDGLEYGTSAVRIGMVRRLVQLLERFAPAALHATQLLGVTRQER